MSHRPERVSELFHQALELPAERRAKFLDDACRDDLALRDEVRSLVQHHDPHTLTDIDERGETGRVPPSYRQRVRHKLAAASLIAALMIATLGWMGERSTRSALERRVAGELTDAVESAAAAYIEWIESQKVAALSWAEKPELVTRVSELVALTGDRDVTAAEAIALAPYRELTKLVQRVPAEFGRTGLYLFSRANVIIFFPSVRGMAMNESYRLSSEGARLVASVFTGETVVSAPFLPGANVTAFPGANVTAEQTRPGRPTILIATPVRDDQGKVMAGLSLRIATEPTFTELIAPEGLDPSSDTFAFNRAGMLVTRSRHETDLERLGLLAQCAAAAPVLCVPLRDPGGDLTAGYRPDAAPETRPLTKVATSVTTGHSGVDVDGYRDVRGVLVVGAWRWLPEYDIGVASERDHRDAYRLLSTIRWTVRAFAGSLLVLSMVTFGSTVSLARLSARLSGADRLGSYRLHRQIGEGGMAKVYRATHVRTNRVVAVKALKPQGASANDVARFEREVRLVSQLDHGNIVDVFDSGRSTDGTLFYAMELVPGITVQELVSREGAVAPERALWICRQVAGAVAEAHAHGVVHRDIKPTNIMLCEKSDGADIVKVLDFGLAKTIEGVTTQITHARLLGGTPTYIAPERIRDPESVDARSDIYSLGAVAYLLLTGSPVVEGATPEEVLLKTLEARPTRPSVHAGGVPPEVDALVLRCLANDPAGRPPTMIALQAELDRLSTKFPWPQERARDWWTRRSAKAEKADAV